MVGREGGYHGKPAPGCPVLVLAGIRRNLRSPASLHSAWRVCVLPWARGQGGGDGHDEAAKDKAHPSHGAGLRGTKEEEGGNPTTAVEGPVVVSGSGFVALGQGLLPYPGWGHPTPCRWG